MRADSGGAGDARVARIDHVAVSIADRVLQRTHSRTTRPRAATQDHPADQDTGSETSVRSHRSTAARRCLSMRCRNPGYRPGG